jgi:hypothetical protein
VPGPYTPDTIPPQAPTSLPLSPWGLFLELHNAILSSLHAQGTCIHSYVPGKLQLLVGKCQAPFPRGTLPKVLLVAPQGPQRQ